MTADWVCKFWLRGTCKRGAFCKALHKITPVNVSDAGEFLESVNRRSLLRATKSIPPVTWSDDEFLCSYNWVDRDTPTIYVPGAPPVWTNERCAFRINKDDNSNTVGRSTSRYAKYPFEPLFRSLGLMKPSFDIGTVDLVTNRNSLRKLFRFVSGDVYEPFRIDVQTQGTVTFLCRWETEVETIVFGSRASGYGHNFEKITTKFEEDLRDSTGHHRAIRYSLGGIQCVVVSEADAFLEEINEPSNDSLPDITEDMASNSLNVIRRGRVVQQAAIVELKSKRKGTKELGTVIPQLWFSRTPNCIVGYHSQGNFQEPKPVPVKEEIESWELNQADHLRMLAKLINRLRELAQASENRGCIVVCELEKPYSVHMNIYDSREKKKVLPDNIVRQNHWTKNM